MVDRYDMLEAACSNADNYPTNLLRSLSFRRALTSYRDRLDEERDRIFDSNPKYALVELLETFDGQIDFSPTQCKNLDALKGHFQVNRKDPRCRHVFIESDHSRAPLDCSKEMFVYVMSFLQVMAPFMDLTFGFGKPLSGKAFHYASFQHEDYISAQQAHRFANPRLGRSGREIRQCYNLWSVERTDAGGPPWSIRQTAVFHSLDLEAGQSLWVNISANDEIKDRITDATASCEALQAESLHDLCGSFSSTLITHLVVFEWCSENWRRYISSLELNLREILDKVDSVPVEEVERALAVDSKALIKPLLTPASTWQPAGRGRTVTRRNTAISMPTSPLNPSVAPTADNPVTPVLMPSSPLAGSTHGSQPGKQGQGLVAESEDNDPFEVLREFSLERLQNLNSIGAALHTASLVIKLNTHVLMDQLEYYESLWEEAEFPRDIKSNCRVHLSQFSQQVRTIVRSLEMERARIETLMLLLHDGRALFDKFLEFRSIEQSKLFTANAHQNAQRMEEFTVDMHNSTLNVEAMTKSMHKIAEKTERETASMHTITVVTLIFLPGTFVATFFGSGLFQWDQNNPVTSTPIWKPGFFVLFSAICFPMMGVIILLWYLQTKWKTFRQCYG
ncbi:hypothetical protein QBC46DRAFT_283190, partial [Diplogelasinospora grovesii]